MDARIKEYNRAINEIAETEGVKYFDLYSATKTAFQENPQKYYSYDKFHPSSEGYIFWGNLIDVN